MKVVKSERKICFCCMEEHIVDHVEVLEQYIFKNEEVEYTAIYEYCSNTDEYLEAEGMIRANSLAIIDACESGKSGLKKEQ